MAEEITPKNERIAQTMATPILMRILKHFSAQDLTEAIKDKINLTNWLKGNPHALVRLDLVITAIPFVNSVGPYLRDKDWIRWFIQNELKHKRPDLYTIIMYNPNAWKWLISNLEELSRFLFKS